MTEYRKPRAPASKGKPPARCALCQAPIIWARMPNEPRRFGGRHHTPFPVERCPPGTGDIALTLGLFVGHQAPLAERVAIGTGYRSHRDHCPALGKSANTSSRSAAAPKSFAAANFTRKKRPASGGAQ